MADPTPPNQSKINSFRSTYTACPDYLGNEFPSAWAIAPDSPAAANRPLLRQHLPPETAADQTPTPQDTSTDQASPAHFPHPASPDSRRSHSAKRETLHPPWPPQSFPRAKTFPESPLSKKKTVARPGATHPHSRDAAQ